MIIVGRVKKKESFPQEVFKFLKIMYEKKKYKIELDYDFIGKYPIYCFKDKLLYPLCEDYITMGGFSSIFLKELSNQLVPKMDKAPLSLIKTKAENHCFGIDLREFYNRIDLDRVIRYSLGWMLYSDSKVLLDTVEEKGPVTVDTIKDSISPLGFKNYLLKDYIKKSRGEYTLDSLAKFLLEVADTNSYDKHLWNSFVVYSPEGVEDYKNLIMNKVQFVSKCTDCWGNRLTFYNFIPFAILTYNQSMSGDSGSIYSSEGFGSGVELIFDLIKKGHVPFGNFGNWDDIRNFQDVKEIVPISGRNTWKTIKPKQVKGKYIEIDKF